MAESIAIHLQDAGWTALGPLLDGAAERGAMQDWHFPPGTEPHVVICSEPEHALGLSCYDATDLSCLEGFPPDALQYLSFGGVIHDESQLRHIARLSGLRTLYMSKEKKVGDAGIQHLGELTGLEVLDLYYTHVTDDGLVLHSALDRGRIPYWI